MEMMPVAGLGIIAAVLAITLRDVKREYAVLLSLGCGALLMIWAAGSARPVLEVLSQMVEASQIQNSHAEILLKALGLSFLTQFASDACRDAGEGAIASKLELCGRVSIVVVSLPLFSEILSLAGSMFSL